MNKHKFIKSLIFANLFVICLTNCSLMPKSKQEDLQKIADSLPALPNPNKSLKNAKTISASPPWLAQLMKTARELGKDEEVSLFPAGMKDNYVPAKVPSKKKNVKITSGYDVRKDSGVTSDQLNAVFKGKLKGKGESVIKISRKYGVDPLFVAGLAYHESAGGTSKYSFDANNVTGQLYKDKKTGKWKPIQFKSVEECLERTCQRMRDVYFKEGRTNIYQISLKYCPVITNKKSKDYNDKFGKNVFWPGKIQEHMKKIQSI